MITATLLAALALAQVQAQVPQSGNVSVPLDEYNKLIELSTRPAKKPDTPPVPYILKAAKLNLAVTGESVSGTITIEGEVLAKGEQKVPLLSGMTVLDAQQRGAELPITQENGVLIALLTGPRDFVVTLKTAVPLTIETGRASFSLPTPAVGAAMLTLTVPGDNTAVNLSSGMITARSSANGRTTIEATLNPGQPATLWWASRQGPALPTAPKEVRFLSDVKTLITVSDSEITIAALAELTIVQGEPAQFTVTAPDGYEMTGATGTSLLTSDAQGKSIRLQVNNPNARSHQFLLSFTKSNPGTKAGVPFITFEGTQRETGEVLIEGEGAIDIRAEATGGLRRMDIKETSPYLRALGRASAHAAFRYQKKPAELPALALEWTRFPDSPVLSAVAQQAVVTTLVTSEGRSLTEVKLTLKNQSQPFLKVGLPAGATILSADVGGDKVKPVQGADGSRVPLLRPGFRPKDAYSVSFVFLHAGAPFEKKGGAELSLPKMDIPIGLVQWEVFLPKQFRIADFGGDAISARGLSVEFNEDDETPIQPEVVTKDGDTRFVVPGQIRGVVMDPAGSVISGALVEVVHSGTNLSRKATSDSSGRWMILGIPSGPVVGTVQAPGFQHVKRQFVFDASRGASFSVTLQVGNVSESIEVTDAKRESQQVERNYRQNAAVLDAPASANVAELQRRVVGVLPIAVSVPRTGSSYRFIRPLVVDEETKLTFTYRTGK